MLFQPHVGCFDRGILSTIYCDPIENLTPGSLQEIYKEFYKKEQFVQILNDAPKLKDIANTNYCQIFPTIAKGKVILFSTMDNLIKGASGQGVQNMNIICGLDETMGLL